MSRCCCADVALNFISYFFFFYSFAICCSGYEEEAIEIFEPLLKTLPRLTYENLQITVDASQNISENEIFRRAIDKQSLRSLVFQVNGEHNL